MSKHAVLDIVGLSASLLTAERTPRLHAWAAARHRATVEPVLPAVTTTAQSTYLTGKLPTHHGIVANGWLFRDEMELKLWRQSNHLVQSPKLWEAVRETRPGFKVANLFWWYAMYSSMDITVTPRPQYLADGRKYPDCYTYPMHLRPRLQKELGTFPLFYFWGPRTDIRSSRWIADAARLVFEWERPDLNLVYLPHLDYNLQRYGENHPSVRRDLGEIDTVAADLIEYYESQGVEVTVLSEYGITDVDRPVHLNRLFRWEGWLSIREERGTELLDVGSCRVVALADHQIAHVYVNDRALLPRVREILERTTGVERVLDAEGKRARGLDHPRAGELVAIADARSWFTYYYWLDDARAPDYARTVDIHRKPGYDPVEMFLDPDKRLVLPRIALKVAGKELGLRTLMNVTPLRAELVRGSHGRTDLPDANKPLLIGSRPLSEHLAATGVYDYLLAGLIPD